MTDAPERPDRAAMIDIAARALIDADSTISGYHETHLAIKRPSAVAMFDALDDAGFAWGPKEPTEVQLRAGQRHIGRLQSQAMAGWEERQDLADVYRAMVAAHD